jgi:3-hydroxyacyl-[acyl-carrier-protein] dehydratase
MRPAQDVLEGLPHRDPFRFVTRLVEHSPGIEARGVWLVTGEEEFFAGHFPGEPIVPGVLLGEALAQVSGLVGGEGSPKRARLAHLNIKIFAAVAPPAEVALHSRLVRVMNGLRLFEVSASVRAGVAASGLVTLADVA